MRSYESRLTYGLNNEKLPAHLGDSLMCVSVFILFFCVSHINIYVPGISQPVFKFFLNKSSKAKAVGLSSVSQMHRSHCSSETLEVVA